MRVLLILLTLLLGACKSNPHGEIPESLYLKAKTFGEEVRWGSLPKMYLFEKQDPDAPAEIQHDLDNVRVTAYELASPLTELEPNRWSQTAVIDYVLTDRQIVRRLIDQQIWVSDDEGISWYRETPVPRFR